MEGRRALALDAQRPAAVGAVYQQTVCWWRVGYFKMMVLDLRAVLRLAPGRTKEPSAAVLDSRTLRSAPESGARAGWDGYKRTRGSKLHMAGYHGSFACAARDPCQ